MLAWYVASASRPRAPTVRRMPLCRRHRPAQRALRGRHATPQLAAHRIQPGLLCQVGPGTEVHSITFDIGGCIPMARTCGGMQMCHKCQPAPPRTLAACSIEAWREGLPNMLPPAALDAAQPGTWPAAAGSCCGVLCINMCHISPVAW